MSARINPEARAVKSRNWFWISLGLAGAAGLVVLGYITQAKAARKPLPKAKGVSPDKAVQQAIAALGVDAHPWMLTDFAYSAAYPECPAVIDPTDPEHDTCRGLWLDMLIKMSEATGLDPDVPIKPPDPSKSTGVAADIANFLAALTANQRSELRTILGAERYDNLVSASEAGNDGSVQALLLAMRKDVEKLVKESPLQAYSLYSQLQKLLGDAKLEEFLEIAK